jgi:hypothetical protein
MVYVGWTISGPISTAYIRIYDMVYNDITKSLPPEKSKACTMCPTVRLVTACGAVLRGELTDLGVLLGAPLQLIKQVCNVTLKCSKILQCKMENRNFIFIINEN